jgi:Uma2 family endonuclease
MVQALQTPVSFDQFIAWYPEQSEVNYELHHGVIIAMPKPTGDHSEVAGYTALKLGMVIEQRGLPYFIPKECVVQAMTGESGYEPDVIVLDRQALPDEPRWKKESIITQGRSIRLVIEVVSTNWQDDYGLKLFDYEALGIPEYWMIDYAGRGGRRYIGVPKRPTLSVCLLVDGEYEIRQFRGNEPIISACFPDLPLTAKQVFAAGQL